MTAPDWRADLRGFPLVAAHDFSEACVLQAREIAANATGEITLLMSGGIQSEWIARLFRRLSIPFRAVLYRINGENYFDIDAGIEFCTENGIKYEILDWDIRKFLAGEVFELAEELQLGYVGPLIGWKMCQMTRGHSVRAAGLPTARWIDGSLEISKLPRWLRERKTAALHSSQFTLAFFSSSDSIAFSYLGHPLFKEWIERSPAVGFENSHEWREILLRSECEELKPRIAWSGLEHVQDSLDEAGRKLRQNFAHL